MSPILVSTLLEVNPILVSSPLKVSPKLLSTLLEVSPTLVSIGGEETINISSALSLPKNFVDTCIIRSKDTDGNHHASI